MAKLKHERNEDKLFAEWMAACSEEGPASSNQPALDQPFQRWFKFKEAFSPRFIHECVRNAGTTVRTCLDPFGGSGTTALTCQFMGISPTTIEVNPFLADLIEAKLTSYRIGSLQRDFEKVCLLSRKKRVDPARILVGGPKTLVEPGVADNWIFSLDVADRILSIRKSIESLTSPKNRRLLRICLGGVLLGLSNAIVNGKGRRYRQNWQNREVNPQSVDATFQVAFSTALGDIQRFSDRATNEYVVLRGDCRTRLPRAARADIAVFSPPYPNSFDYTDIYNIELWMLGYLRTSSDNKRLRNRTLRSHVQVHRPFKTLPGVSRRLDRTYCGLCDVRADLWNPHLPEMVMAYFTDLLLILRTLYSKLNRRGRAFIVVGNSQYEGVLVDVRRILNDLAPHARLRVLESRPIRSMRSSAQQGGNHDLTESLVVLERD